MKEAFETPDKFFGAAECIKASAAIDGTPLTSEIPLEGVSFRCPNTQRIDSSRLARSTLLSRLPVRVCCTQRHD